MPDAVLPPVATYQESAPSVPVQQDPCPALDQSLDLFDSGSSAMSPSSNDSGSSPNAEILGLDFSSWDSTTFIDPTHLIPKNPSSDILRAPKVTDFVDCGCPIRHVEVLVPPTLNTTSCQIVRIGPSVFSADPYMNSLRIKRMCFVEAMWANCLHMGITLDNFCGEDSISPFSRQTIMGADNGANDAMVRTVQSIFKTLKPDLRPTWEQITMKHCPFFDIIPFPTFRKNLIINQDKVSEEEICHDMMEGLICWGGVGISERDREGSNGRTSTGAPWDSRSWEARPWFLRKHWDLLGGEEGELVRQSEWWRIMRGEESNSLLAF